MKLKYLFLSALVLSATLILIAAETSERSGTIHLDINDATLTDSGDSILVIFAGSSGGTGSIEWSDISNKNLGAGKGLSFTDDSFSVNVNPASLEIVNDTIKIKTGGITSAEIANGSILAEDIASLPPPDYPPPIVTNINPNNITLGYSSFTATITGTGFQIVSQARVGSNDLTNENVLSSTAMTATIPAGLTGGTYNVSVSNLELDWGTGTGLFTINVPVPTVSGINPNSKQSGYSSFSATITGTNFISSYTQARIGTTDLTGESVSSSTSMTATVPAGIGIGTYNVYVSNDGTNWSTGTNLFTVTAPCAGYWYGGYCWYESSYNSNCNTACTGHGGCVSAGLYSATATGGCTVQIHFGATCTSYCTPAGGESSYAAPSSGRLGAGAQYCFNSNGVVGDYCGTNMTWGGTRVCSCAN